ncbi:YdcH family protein [Aquella oligotrophica]|jgi:uncharacterized protein YdcH (DUF465 family)|uniref:GTP-binding protein n=1 Tax=Aquella oligotrophica TaxID=2067065 RepID=A0A2I7N5M1_9NEIS|nr:DUF465 domain-containing protein [Aquella oligotrophica]AUR51767.1 GTP-binding protein [Aquella oligotrophica]
MRTPNQNLTESFPELKESFHELKMNDHHFQHILKKYEELDTLVHKVDHEQEVMSDFELEKVKKERVLLKDELYNMMNNHKNTRN